jgi:hypothetical protein
MQRYTISLKENFTMPKLKQFIALGLSLALLSLQPVAFAVQEDKQKLAEGTEVELKFVDALSSKTANEGDPVNLQLAEDIKVNGVVVAKAVGTISHAKKAGMLGKAGELNMRIEHLKAGDNRIRLRGSKGKEGEGKEGTMIVLTVLFGPLGLIKKGKNVEIKEGTAIKAFVDEDIMLPAIK